MEVLRAQEKDIDSIEKIYESVHNQEEKGLTSTGWVRDIKKQVSYSVNLMVFQV